MSNRDIGIRGAGKGDNDRTSDVKKFQENLEAIPLNPADKTGFEKVASGRYRKTYGKPVPTPDALMPAQRASRAAISGNSSES